MNERGNPSMSHYQYSVLLQDMDGETLDQKWSANKSEALVTGRYFINKSWKTHGLEIKALICDNFNRSKPVELTLIK